MKSTLIRRVLSTTAIITATAAITTTVISQYEDMPQEALAEMEAWMALGTPGPEHEEMADWAGDWTQEQTYWMWPGADPENITMTAKIEPLFDGRFMLEHVKGKSTMPDGQEVDVDGMGIFGFDRVKNKHFFIWISGMGTGVMYGEGDADATGKTITYFSEMPSPTSDKVKKFKTVSRELSPDKSELIMYEQLADGTYWKHMLIKSKRRQ